MAAELPMPWPSLSALRVSFRRGQASLLASAPGGGKSTVAMAYAMYAEVPTLFISADTDLTTMAIRTASAVLGWPQAQVEASLSSLQVQQAIESTGHIRWADGDQPTVQDIYQETLAYCEVLGDFPALIVVDNLIDIQAERGSDKDWSATRAVVDGLKRLARESEAHVLILAHATGRYEDGDIPIPLGGLEWKPGKNVELVLTMYQGEDRELRVCPVKNRMGKASAKGTLYVPLYADMDHVSVHDKANGRWILGRKTA
jgi:predicted ATP-dependent serine protease